MATTKSATINIMVAASVELAADGASGAIVSVKDFNNGVRALNSSTTPPVTKCYAIEMEFAGSSAAEDTQTIDLSDFDDIEGVAQDAQGLRLQGIHVVADADNIEEVTIGPAATNGYNLFGPGNEIDVQPGGELAYYGHDGMPEIEGDSSGALNSDISVIGNGGDIVQILLLLG